MTDTQYTPIPPDELDAMTDALNGYRKAVVQANACTSVDGVVDALEVIAVAANKAMPYFSRLLAEAREAQRLRGELMEALEDIKGQCETDFVGCSRCGADEPLTDTDVYETARQAIAKAKGVGCE